MAVYEDGTMDVIESDGTRGRRKCSYDGEMYHPEFDQETERVMFSISDYPRILRVAE